jgi:hypothetical protein
MDTKLPDPLRSFCEQYISQNCQKWPTSEIQLAEVFVKHFSISVVTNLVGLQDFLVRTNIEHVEGNLPADLLAVNMSFEGKRKILTAKEGDHVSFQVHTVLHEIREIIEADFHRLGSATTSSQDLDHLADVFAFAVPICAAMPSLGGLLENDPEIWPLWVSLGAFTVGAVGVLLYSFVGAFGYRFPNSAVKRHFLKHS